MLVASVATLLMVDRMEAAKEVALNIIHTHPKFRTQLVLSYAEEDRYIDPDDTVGVLFASLIP